jgi:hypothetical protein
MIAQNLARALGGHRAGAAWMARCPAHADRKPRLSIRDADNKVLLHGHAGCDPVDVIDALPGRGLWPSPSDELVSRRAVPPPKRASTTRPTSPASRCSPVPFRRLFDGNRSRRRSFPDYIAT